MRGLGTHSPDLCSAFCRMLWWSLSCPLKPDDLGQGRFNECQAQQGLQGALSQTGETHQAFESGDGRFVSDSGRSTMILLQRSQESKTKEAIGLGPGSSIHGLWDLDGEALLLCLWRSQDLSPPGDLGENKIKRRTWIQNHTVNDLFFSRSSAIARDVCTEANFNLCA